jgi:hypothetical protein
MPVLLRDRAESAMTISITPTAVGDQPVAPTKGVRTPVPRTIYSGTIPKAEYLALLTARNHSLITLRGRLLHLICPRRLIPLRIILIRLLHRLLVGLRRHLVLLRSLLWHHLLVLLADWRSIPWLRSLGSHLPIRAGHSLLRRVIVHCWLRILRRLCLRRSTSGKGALLLALGVTNVWLWRVPRVELIHGIAGPPRTDISDGRVVYGVSASST